MAELTLSFCVRWCPMGDLSPPPSPLWVGAVVECTRASKFGFVLGRAAELGFLRLPPLFDFRDFRASFRS